MKHSLAIMITLCLIIISCTSIKPQRQDVEIPEGYTNASSTTTPMETLNWWKEFNDAILNKLVAEAVEKNFDIKVATERITRARAVLGATHALRFPTLQLNISASRQRQVFLGSSVFRGNLNTTYNTYNLNLTVNYEADIWGKLSSEQKKALATVKSVEQLKRVVLQTVISDVVTLYFHIQALKEMLTIKEQFIQNAESNVQVIKERYKLGKASYLELLQAQSFLAEARSEIEPLKRQLKQTLYRLSIIIGRYPQELHTTDTSISTYINHLKPIPAGLPSELLLRRPDIQAQAMKVEEAFQALKVARAKRFPSITLTGSGGWISSELKALFRPESLFWQLSLGIFQSLFDAGRLKYQELAAASSYKEMLITYSKTVLQAFYEVEKALMERKSLYIQLNSIKNTVAKLQKTFNVASNRYRLGLVDLTTLLQLQRQLFTAKVNLTKIEEAILTNRVFLYKALGGKWTKNEILQEGVRYEG